MENLTIRDIATKIAPVAEKYALRYVWLFGSRARGDARPDSDVDLLITREGSSVKSLLDLSGLYIDFQEVLGAELDLVTLEGLNHELNFSRASLRVFRDTVDKEKVLVYEFGKEYRERQAVS